MTGTPLPCPRAKRGEATSVPDVCETVWAQEMAPVRERWRARELDPRLTEAQREYAARRRRTLTRPYADRVAKCRTREMRVKCGCPDEREHPYGCRQHLVCTYCRWQRALHLTTRIRDALQDRWNHAPKHSLIVMATISLRHTGDIRADRRELAQSWMRFRKSCHRRWGAFDFVGTFEVTPGRDRLGHVHAHMVCIWPRGTPGDATQGDWQTLQRLWVAASTGRDGVQRSSRISFEASKRPRDAAAYVAKYIGKGVTTAGFDPQLAARVASGTYNTRWVVTSRGFWLPWPPPCKHCGQPVCRVSRFGWSDRVPTPFETPTEDTQGAAPWRQETFWTEAVKRARRRSHGLEVWDGTGHRGN